MKPLPGNYLFEALNDKECILIACNTRVVPGVVKGIMRAAKKMDAAIIFELAKTECNEEGGYTGLTPQTHAEAISKVADEVGFESWSLHADHIGIKKDTDEEMSAVKKLVDAQIKAGYTSFAIDASHLFNFEGKTPKEELEPNSRRTIELAKYIKEQMGDKTFGLEVEVGEIGRKNTEGMILTTPEEAVEFIKAINEAGIKPNAIAIANGSTHGNIFDKDGNQIAQVSIDIEQTKAVAKALRDNGFNVGIAQHGITGTPVEFINTQFPKKDLNKGNVGTLWQNIFFEALKLHHPDLYKEMYDWTMENKPIEGKKPAEIFGKNGKHSLKQFFEKIHSLSTECYDLIEAMAYAECLKFLKAFNAKDSAAVVREYIKNK